MNGMGDYLQMTLMLLSSYHPFYYGVKSDRVDPLACPWHGTLSEVAYGATPEGLSRALHRDDDVDAEAAICLDFRHLKPRARLQAIEEVNHRVGLLPGGASDGDDGFAVLGVQDGVDVKAIVAAELAFLGCHFIFFAKKHERPGVPLDVLDLVAAVGVERRGEPAEFAQV